MTNGQIAQLRDLSKCFMPRRDRAFLNFLLFNWTTNEIALDRSYRFDDEDKIILRRLTHQYRNQIRAIKKNQRAKE